MTKIIDGIEQALGPDATTALKGKVELATDAETVTGTSDVVVTTPGNITAKMAAPGAIGGTTPATGAFLDTDIQDQINLKDGTDTHIIKAVQEPGLGGRFTIGLDETARTMVICDAGDVDTDFGMSVETEPSITIYNSALTVSGILRANAFQGSYDLVFKAPQRLRFFLLADQATFNPFNFVSDPAIEITASTAIEQSWVYIEPKINQTHANSAANALKIMSTLTGEGDGTAGYGNNLILAGTSADHDMFKVDNTGRIVLAETTTPAALADHAFMYAKDATGGQMFVADAAADETQITPHNFSLFEPDPNEAYPWTYYSQSHTLGKKINVDMAGAIRAIEALSGKKFIYYEDIPKSVDLEATYKKQWRQEWIRDNTTDVEVTIEEAMEMVEVDERVLYGVVDPKTGKIKKQGKKLGEKITGYELVDGEVKPKIEIIWEMKKVLKSQVKEDVRFDETDGKFYKKVIPTSTQAEAATKKDFIFEIPQWLEERLAKKAMPL